MLSGVFPVGPEGPIGSFRWAVSGGTGRVRCVEGVCKLVVALEGPKWFRVKPIGSDTPPREGPSGNGWRGV